MALAILKYLEQTGGQYLLEADIGTNAYYQFKIGKRKEKRSGLETVDDISHQSALMKSPSLNNRGFQTRFILKIPDNLITRENRFVQLYSFKGQDRVSPAISEVATLVPSISDFNDDFKLPKVMTFTHTNGHSSMVQTDHAPCHIKENKVSEAMFFNAILGALPNLLSNALPMIGKIIPGLQKALPIVAKAGEKLLPELSKLIPTDVKAGQEGVNQVLQNISPETLKAILEVIQSVSTKTDNSAEPAKSESKSMSQFSHDFAINPSLLMQLAPLLEKVLSPETIAAIGDNPVKLFKAISDSAVKLEKMGLDATPKPTPTDNGSALDKTVQTMALRRYHKRMRYSEAKVAPALLAALPALLPVLEKVLSPDMIKAIGEQPVKLFTAIADAGLKHTQQELQHLEKINPGVDDPGFDKIVASMSLKSGVSIKANYSNAYTIEFADVITIPIGTKPRVVFDRRQKLHLPVKVVTTTKSNAMSNGHAPHTNGQAAGAIPKAIFQLIVQDGDSMKVLLEKKIKVKNLQLNTPIQDITLDTEEIKNLPLNQDLKLELSLSWKKGGKVEGTFKNHYITLCDGYLYQRPGQTIKQHFALNDVTRFRKYWHKVWEGGPDTHQRWKIDFECKYYYQLNDKDPNIKVLETRKQIVSDSAKASAPDDYRRKISGKLKSGMGISVAACNELLSQHQLAALAPAQLSAFIGKDFAKETSLAARVSVDFKGKRGDTAALWTYPEGNFQSYVLSKVNAVDPSGMVKTVEEEEVFFPRFSTIHFIGTKSE